MEKPMKRYLVFAFPLLLGACGVIQPWQPEFCKTAPYSCNQNESPAQSAPGGNPAPAAAKAAPEPEKPSKPDKPEKPDRPDKPDRPGHGGDKPGRGDHHSHDRKQPGHGETGKRSGDEK